MGLSFENVCVCSPSCPSLLWPHVLPFTPSSLVTTALFSVSMYFWFDLIIYLFFIILQMNEIILFLTFSDLFHLA